MERKNIRNNRNTKINKNISVTNNNIKESSEIIRVKKKYNPKFVMISNLFELHLIFLLIIGCFIVTKQFLSLFIVAFIYITIVVISLLLYKKSAIGTYISFQEDKVVYVRKFLLNNTREEMKYKDIKEIAFGYDIGSINKFWQKHMNMGNITIYPKKGNVFIHGIEITNVGPFDKLMVDIKKNIGDKIV